MAWKVRLSQMAWKAGQRVRKPGPEGQPEGMEPMNRVWEVSLRVWRPTRMPGRPILGPGSQPEVLRVGRTAGVACKVSLRV